MNRFFVNIINKLNPAQQEISEDFGPDISPAVTLYNNQKAYKTIEVVNRGVNLITDGVAGIRIDVGEMLDNFNSKTRIRKKKLDQLLNFRPNPYYNADVLKRNIVMDLLLEGDAFLYWDGAYLYNLPALDVKFTIDDKTYISEYSYGEQTFKPSEIIHIQENGDNVFHGISRLDSARDTMNTLISMKTYQKKFFDNSAVPGLILTTPNPLSERVKTRMINQWIQKYNPLNGKRPMILDGEFKVEPLNKVSFKELDFNESIKAHEETILRVLGVPPVLLDAGNNANINPNLRMFYINTIMPLEDKFVQAIEMYFGYDIKPITQDVLALRPELRDWSTFLTSVTNAGILTRNEAREELRKEPMDGHDELIIPANVAGSAVNPGTGGKPTAPKNEDKK